MKSNGPPADGPERTRVDEDDHDLLTFGEAGERLRREIAALEHELTRLGSDTAAMERAQRRLATLRSAQARNSSQPINDSNFEKFFGYSSTPKRR
ncbi:acyl-CoA synthetase [Mycobacterium paraffinicum]|uniref:Acyl-CoA synthetase n=1 Tax=Mycobacterium paraffinicum TaxID=53378 RepID=A0A1Q4I2P3_9MYCO|nr:acyl-CoA synthetase [Mycobacterium paraffinicum]OJZ76150.1 acyl-CoA synthetase [Mycobacterium paraffinicum]